MAEVVFSNVGLVLDGQSVLGDLSLVIPDGSLTAIIGPSGSGKSSMLRLVSGLLAPTSGSVTIGGALVDSHTPGKNRVAMVFQDDAIFEHLTVGGNLEFPWRVRGSSGSEAFDQGMIAARKLGIRRLWDRRPRSLSGGQRDQLATARALSRTDPSVVLLDEPLISADAAVRHRFRSEIVRLHAEVGTTLILATNDQSEAMSVATHCAVLMDGAIVQFDSPQQLYRNPVSSAVAGFLGSPPMNLFPARSLRSEGMVEIGNDRVSIDIDPDRLPSRVLVGVHPADLHAAAPGTPFDRTISATLGRVEDLGPYSLGYFGLGTSGIGFSLRLPGRDWRAGDHLELTWSADLLRLFDAETGLAISA